MTPHYCKVEKSQMMISGCCNWCGEKEANHVTVLSDKLALALWAVVATLLVCCIVAVSFMIGWLV